MSEVQSPLSLVTEDLVRRASSSYFYSLSFIPHSRIAYEWIAYPLRQSAEGLPRTDTFIANSPPTATNVARRALTKSLSGLNLRHRGKAVLRAVRARFCRVIQPPCLVSALSSVAGACA